MESIDASAFLQYTNLVMHIAPGRFCRISEERMEECMQDTIAVLIPCYNEAVTIGKVVDDFKRVLPEADIYVYDNNSSDGTADIARDRGAIVRH